MTPQKKQLAVIACPRSGTLFISKFIQEALQIPADHETRSNNVGVHVDWSLPANKGALKNYSHVIHQAREPLSVISSLTTIAWRQHYRARRFEDVSGFDTIDQSRLLMAMKLYYHWNLKCESLSEWTYKVENIGSGKIDVLDKICSYLGKKTIDYSYILEYCKNNNKINSRTHKKYTWEDLEAESSDLTLKIQKLAKRLGYQEKPKFKTFKR